MNQYPYYNPYLPQIQQNMAPVQNVLPPQQIMQASGRESVQSIKLSPNSSVLIADSTRPIIYKCISDSLGNSSIEEFDVSPHKSEEKVEQENIQVMINDLRKRIERLEHESNSFRNAAAPNNAESNANEEITSAMKLSICIEDVDKELKWVERKLLELQSSDYAMDFILDEQQYYHEFYKKKMAEKS